MKNRLFTIALVILSLLMLSVSGASAVTLSILDVSGESPLTTQIRVDDPVGIAGAAFTLNYDTTALDISVESDFFDTFENQLSGTPYSGPYEADGYSQPLVTHEVSGTGMKIAAARCTPADNSSNVLFTLTVSLIGPTEGAYPITITATELSNTAAGYSESGEPIDLLIGSDTSKDVSDPDAFPVLLAKGDGVYATGTVTIEGKAFHLDVDGNGSAEPSKDGVLIRRYLLNYHVLYPGVWTTGVIGFGATRDEAEIITFITNGLSNLDIDGNGNNESSKDGVLISRFLNNYHALYPGVWTTGVIGTGATRDEQAIIDYLKTLLP